MEKIYFNNAATSWPKAPGLGQVLAQATEEIPSHPGRTGYAEEPDHVQDCRERLANLLSVDDAKHIVLCQNATFALNFALLGFPFRRGDIVLTTAQEHNAVLRPLYWLRSHRRIRLEIVPVDARGRVDPDDVDKAVRRQPPRVVVLNHASNVTGAVQPAFEVFSAAKSVGAVTLLDASQAIGLETVSPGGMAADMVAFTGHKYLLGPTGTGGLYVSPQVSLAPVVTGGTGVWSDLTRMPPEMPDRLEPGTPNVPAFLGLAHALKWQGEHPADQGLLDRLVQRLADGLAGVGARVYAAKPPRTPVVSFTLPGWSAGDAGYAFLNSFGFICRSGLHCAPLIHKYLGTFPEGTLRLSLSRFNTDDEVDFAVRAVSRLVK